MTHLRLRIHHSCLSGPWALCIGCDIGAFRAWSLAHSYCPVLPADCRLLHPTSRSADSAVHITHALRFTMRLSRGDDAATDSKTDKRRLFGVVIRAPVHILSMRSPLFISNHRLTYLQYRLDSVSHGRNTSRSRATRRRSTIAQCFN
jgi:hypothetical protein